MIMYNGVAVFKLRVEWQCTLKERRQISQKVRDHIKNQFNASVKLDYEEELEQNRFVFNMTFLILISTLPFA